MPGAAQRTLAFPPEVADEFARLAHGAASFLMSVDSKGWWVAEDRGKLVLLKSSALFTSTAAGKQGDVWFAEDSPSGPQLKCAKLNFAQHSLFDVTVVPLPGHAELQADGASAACLKLAVVDAIVAPEDGSVWLSASCTGGARVVLRSLLPLDQ